MDDDWIVDPDAVEPSALDRAFPTVTEDFWREPGPAVEWTVKGWLQAYRIGMLTGKGGTGKTKLAVMLAAAVAAGIPGWLPGGPALGRTGQGRVAFASWENTRDEIRHMLCDWPEAAHRDRRETLPALLGDRFRFRNLAGLGPLWSAETQRGGLTELGKRLRDDAAESDLLILDPLAAAYADNENDRAKVRAFMADWTGWAAEAETTILLLAHPSKSDSEFSGSTDWYAASRSVWTMGMDGDDDRTKLECVKVNAAPRPKPLRLDNWQWWRATSTDAPDETMADRIIATLKDAGEAISQRSLEANTTGNGSDIRREAKRLAEDGRIVRENKGQALMYSLPESTASCFEDAVDAVAQNPGSGNRVPGGSHPRRG